MKNIKPISFIGILIIEILSGFKTMTRRIIHIPKWALGGYENFEVDEQGELVTVCADTGCMAKVPTRYHKGDVLYVKESGWSYNGEYHYSVDYLTGATGLVKEAKRFTSRFMPRKAARLWLRVTDVRIERVQEILCGDMKREGCVPKHVTGGQWQQWQRDYWIPLWNAINAKRGYGWDINPWVEVVTFERCEKPEGV